MQVLDLFVKNENSNKIQMRRGFAQTRCLLFGFFERYISILFGVPRGHGLTKFSVKSIQVHLDASRKDGLRKLSKYQASVRKS